MFYGISWHHGVLNVPWRVQNLRTRSFVTRVHWPWYSICNYLCNNILLLWLWAREREQVNDPSLLTALPAAAPAAALAAATQGQHRQTFKLIEKYSEYYQHTSDATEGWNKQWECDQSSDQPEHSEDRITFPKNLHKYTNLSSFQFPINTCLGEKTE